MKYKIKIRLLSDMCPSSGEVYNSSVDTEIDYDVYGFPYLSAKRIKGCMRECAQMLNEWGMSEINTQVLFGNQGNERGKLRLGSAKIENYAEYIKEIENNNSILTAPKNILDLFTYVRVQTAMEDGVAKDGSLRVLRVIKKDTVFEAEAEIPEKYEGQLETICKTMRNMGLNRTRGLGEVEVTMEPVEEAENANVPEGYNDGLAEGIDTDKTYRLNYRIKCLEPVILKSSDKGQEKTQDYIEGSKMLGILAGKFGQEGYKNLNIRKNIICSNLYVTDDKERYLPVPESMCRIKDDTTGTVHDLASGEKIDEQIKGMGDCYVLTKVGEIKILSVDTKIRYHHSRPTDKSIGRATGDGNGELYQMSSVVEGQTFAGFIQGSGEQISQILIKMKEMRYVAIGYGRASEYGKCELIIDGIDEYSETETVSEKEIMVKLLAPVVMYNNVGMYTQDVARLAEILSKKLGVEVEPDVKRMYLKQATIGGWQSMWQKPKQTFKALDKGSVIIMNVSGENVVKLQEQSLFVGERNTEGYGEIQISKVPENSELKEVTEKSIVTDEECNEAQEYEEGTLLYKLDEVQKVKELKEKGRKAASEVIEKFGEKAAPTINKLLLTLKEVHNIEAFKEVCDSIKTETKAKQAKEILKMAQDKEGKFLYGDEDFVIFMTALLTEAKYLARGKKEGKNNG